MDGTLPFPLPGMQPAAEIQYSEDDYAKVIDAAVKWEGWAKKEFENYTKRYKDGRFPDKEVGVSVNRMFSYITMLLAYLMSQSPQVEVEPRAYVGGDEYFMPLVQLGIFPNPEEAKRAFAELIETEQLYAYEHTDSATHNLAALFYALVQGQGVVKVGFDPDRGLDRVDALWRHEVYWDPHARYTLAQASYVCQTCIWPIRQAQEFFLAKGVTGLEANFKLGEGDGLQAEMQSKAMPESKLKDLYKFYEIWAKEGDERKLYYFEARSKKLIASGPWPFQLDRDDFPFCILSFNSQFTQVSDAFSDLHVIDGLTVTYEELFEYFRRHTARSRAKKVVYDKAKFSPDDVERLKSAKDMEFIGIDPEGRPIREHVQVVEFNSGTEADEKVLGAVKAATDEITGVDELVRNAGAEQTKGMTATEASVRDANSKLRAGRRQKILDDFLTEQTRKRALIAAQLVSPEKIEKIAGKLPAILWSAHPAAPDDIMAEYSISILAGSTGERHRQTLVQEAQQDLQLFSAVNQMLMGSGRPPVFNEVEAALEILKARKRRNLKRFLLQAPPPMMAPPQPGMAAPQGQPQGMPQLPPPEEREPTPLETVQQPGRPNILPFRKAAG